jgi:RNA polymerase sigma-70 factor, ECF subfamily
MTSSCAASAADMPMPAVCEDDLIAGIGARDGNALARVYDAHHVALRALARRLVGDETIAEDLVHDTFVALPGAIRGFRGSSSLRTFVMGIAVNRARKYIRAATRRRAAYERHAAQPAPAESPAPDVALARRQLAAALHHALDGLPHDQRIAFVLCGIEELTSAEAATVMGCPEETVRTRLFHARKKLRTRFEAEDLR